MIEFWIIKAFNIMLSILFLAGAWSAKKVIGVWLNPASIFLLFWFLYTFMPLLLAFEVPVNPLAIIYLLIFGLFFSLPFTTIRWNIAFKANEAKKDAAHVFNRRSMVLGVIVCSLFSTCMAFISVLQQGISIQQIIMSPLSAGGIYASNRYSGDIVSSIYSQLGLQFSYYSAVLGGLVYGSRKPYENKIIFLVLAFLPATLIMLLQSAKGLFFFSIFLFSGGVLVTRIFNKNYNLINLATLRAILPYVVIAIPFVVASFLSRGLYQLDDSSIIFDRLRAYLVSYSSVHLPAFSDWFSHRYFGESLFEYKQETATLGFYTFMAFFRLFGDAREIPLGVYDEFYFYGEFIKGNLYTVFRGLISDFGLIGSLLLAIIMGYIAAMTYRNLIIKKLPIFSIVFFIFFIGFSYQSFIISSLMWLTIPGVIIIQWIMLTLLIKIRY